MSVEIPLSGGPLRLGDEQLVDHHEFGETWPSDWKGECGMWEATADGLVGSTEGDWPAVVWCLRDYPFDHAIGVCAKAIAPNTNDANGFFRGVGRINGPEEHRCWIAGNAGWWQHDDGLEKHPGGPTWRHAGSPLPDTPIRFWAGVKDDVVFLYKDGRLIDARPDPAPLPAAEFPRIGLGTWDSKICFLWCDVFRI